MQQHWQRGGDAVSRLDHPRAPNAPANAGAGSWTRVLVPLAGANWGTVMLPRVGQEVWLDYLEGDIDRPVVVAALYNGQGAPDAPGNSVAGGPAQASANAPAWFAGNGHPGVFAGFKSQDLSTSATGQGGYRQLRFDDTPGQGHFALSTTDYASSLVLGHIKHVVDNARQADLGYGAALATEAQGALRAGAGLYATTRPGAAPMDAAAARHALDGQRRLAEDLATLARQQQAALPDESAQAPLPAVAATQALLEDLAGTRTGQAAGQGIGGGEGTAPAWTRPHLLAHGEDGLLALTPQSHVLVSGTDSLLSAGQDLDLTAQGELSLIAAKGIALYTQGTAPATDRPVATTGIALHAATGSLHLQAQQDELRMAAQKAITLASVRGEVNASARQQTLLTAAGAYLKLTPRDIEIGAPGRAEFKAMQRELNGPMTAAFQADTRKAEAAPCNFRMQGAAANGDATVPLRA